MSVEYDCTEVRSRRTLNALSGVSSLPDNAIPAAIVFMWGSAVPGALF